jgi:hypothetical protein
MIDCHVIYNQPTDKAEWLDRCVASLAHDDVMVHVHRFAESAPVNPRRLNIFKHHNPERWIMFADPDDYVVQSEYDRFVAAVLASENDCVWCPEIILGRGEPQVNDRPHHPVALRGQAVLNLIKHPRAPHLHYPFFVARGERVEAFPYRWVTHENNTRGRA